MLQEPDRKTNVILKIIADSKEPIGSAEISQKLKELGINLSERTVRYHLKRMNEQGLLKIFWKEGRMITRKGQEELENAFVSDKVGFAVSRMDAMSYLMDFNLENRTGSVILNISFFHKNEFKQALKVMREVFKCGLSMGNKVMIAEAGEEVGEIVVPTGRIGFGTLCAINLNALLIKNSIPIESKFGGILQIENASPLRFTDLISYSGSTLDPHEIFIKSKMTDVRGACNGFGKILAGFREIPAIAKEDAETILLKAKEAGISNVITIGKPNQSILGIPVGPERAGIVVPGGLNPVAAAEEWGVMGESKAIATLVDYSQLKDFAEL